VAAGHPHLAQVAAAVEARPRRVPVVARPDHAVVVAAVALGGPALRLRGEPLCRDAAAVLAQQQVVPAGRPLPLPAELVLPAVVTVARPGQAVAALARRWRRWSGLPGPGRATAGKIG
jgi:hypothetical protein